MTNDAERVSHYVIFTADKLQTIIGVDTISETNKDVAVPANYFKVPVSVQQAITEHPFGTFRINNGDVESVAEPLTLDALRSAAVTAIIHRMEEVLGRGITREKNGKHYRFTCSEETVMQLSLFSGGVSPMFVKTLNEDTSYFEAVEFTVLEIQNIQNDLAKHWSTANRIHLDALNEIKRATRLQDVISICKETGVKVL